MDAFVETVDESNDNEESNSEAELERSLSPSSVITFLQSYGWQLLALSLIACLLWRKIFHKFKSWQQNRTTEKFFANYHQDPQLARARQEAFEASRMRLQKQHDDQAEAFVAKLKKKEEEKRQEKINEWEKLKEGASYHSRNKYQEEEIPEQRKAKAKPRLRNDYNPLMGSGESSIRPSRSRNCDTGG